MAENLIVAGSNTGQTVVDEEELLELNQPISFVPSPLVLMADIESLAVGPRSVVLSFAMLAYDQDEGEIISNFHVHSFLPIQIQMDKPLSREVNASTLLFWLRQSDEAKADFERSIEEADESLYILMNHLAMEFNRVTRGRDYELWARGPQFDIVNLESLFHDVNMEVPWDYWRVQDLRTLVRQSGLDESHVAKPKGFVAHNAMWDVRYQLAVYEAAKRALRAGE